ncbi:hypothetical protein, partial [Alistipes sp.]|uniref:hypothetical protein n=1 Tax=Alistipes sp. TaxID=1872444 RepID=UPI0023F37F07
LSDIFRGISPSYPHPPHGGPRICGGSGSGRAAGNRNGTSGRGFGDRKSGNERPGGKCLRQPRSPGSRNGTTGRG